MNNNNLNVDELNKSINRLCNEISKLSLILSSRFTSVNDDQVSTDSKTNKTNKTSKSNKSDKSQIQSINETIVLYSLSNEPLIKDLNLI